jgi:hypothetical protein
METEVVEVVVKGPGQASVALFDRNGTALLRRVWRFSGHPQIEIRSRLPTTLQTTRGRVPVVPVVVRAEKDQKVSLDGAEPGAHLEERCRALKWPRTAVAKISRVAARLGEGRETLGHIAAPTKRR